MIALRLLKAALDAIVIIGGPRFAGRLDAACATLLLSAFLILASAGAAAVLPGYLQ